MKKYLLLSLLISIMILFAGCPHKTEKPKEETTVLTIKNQTSFSIKDIKYSDQTVSLLQAGSSSSVQLAEKATGYLYFTVYDETKNVSFSVRANDTIIVEKGKTQIFNITDNTLVIQTGQTQPIKILNLMNAAVLKIYNETSWDIVEINYGGKIHKETIVSGKEWKTEFGDTMQHELKLTVLKKKDNTTVSFTLKDIVAIELGKTKEVRITNTTLAVQEGKTEPEEIRHLLGGCTLTVINESSAESISNISCGGVTHTASIQQNASCKLELQDSLDDYLIFYVKTKYVTFKVKTDAKITVKSKEEKTITIDNTMDVIVLALKYDDGETPTEGDDLTKVLKLQKVVDAALLDITNKSSAELLNVTYDKCNAGVIDAYDGTAEEEPWVQFDCWDFPTTATHITFDIKLPEKLINLKTVEPIVLANSDKTKFTFTNKTKVINVETGITTTIGKVIGLSSLTVVNGTTAKLSNFQYGEQKADTSLVVSQNDKWEVEFTKPVQDYLTFKIRNNYVTVKTADKISINSGEEKIFNITDDTAVIPSEAQEPTTVYKVLHAATLEISNGSSVKLYNVKYGDRNFGDLTIESEGDSINALNYWDITNTALPISFELQKSKKKVKVKTEEMIKLTADKRIEFSITNATKLIVEDSGGSLTISNFLIGKSKLIITNQSSEDFQNVYYAYSHGSGGDGSNWFLKNESRIYEYDCDVDSDISFRIIRYYKGRERWVSVKTVKKLYLIRGEENSFAISDDTIIGGDYDAADATNAPLKDWRPE